MIRMLWWRLSMRGRVCLVVATLIVFSGLTHSLPDLSAILNGFAVLVLAGAGLWMIVTAPLQRRRW